MKIKTAPQILAHRLPKLAAALSLALLAVPAVRAASFAFNVSTVAADSDVANFGLLTYAYAWSSTSGTVNGVPFTYAGAFNTSVGGGNITLGNFTSANGSAFTSATAPFGSLSAAYKAIQVGSVFNGTSNTVGTVTLNNLTTGRK